MKEKEMKRLSRAEILELLLEQTKEAERLQQRLDQIEAMLSSRNLRIQEPGDLAQAAAELNDVIITAQTAARHQMESIAEMEAETRKTCEKMIADAWEEAKAIGGNSREPAQDDASDN